MPAAKIALREADPIPSPERAFRALASDERPFFLDTALRLPGFGRFSILGSRPFLTLESKGTKIALREGGRRETHEGNPFHFLRKLLGRYALPAHPTLPFAGGAVGYLGYDLRHFVERLPSVAEDDLPFPDMAMAFYDTALVVDHEAQRAWVAAAELGVPGRGSAERRVGELAERLSGGAPSDPPPAVSPARKGGSPEPTCNFTRADYLRAIQRCKDYIAAGNIFQVNLSRRLQAPISISPAELYLRLRRVNPAPMAAYLAGNDFAVLSASPERFLRARRGRVETRPIKGTRPRGGRPGKTRRSRRSCSAARRTPPSWR